MTLSTAMPSDDMTPLKPPAAAEYLGLAVGTLNNRRSAGLGPTYIRLPNRQIRYRVADLQAWLDAGEVVEAAA